MTDSFLDKITEQYLNIAQMSQFETIVIETEKK